MTDAAATATAPVAAPAAAVGDGSADPGATGGAAARAAAAAAAAAGVALRELEDVSDLQQVHRLVDEIWGPDLRSPPVTVEMMRALATSGNYVVGAYRGRELLGACVGFFGAPGSRSLHSHVAAVAAAARGRSVGFALKIHQRAWALARAVPTIFWTFDPLLARNAAFNIVKLGARPVAYLPDFYGPMTDLINRGDSSDRLLIRWDLLGVPATGACAGHPVRVDPASLRGGGAQVVLDRAPGGGPGLVGSGSAGRGRTVLVAVPEDVEALRRAADPRLAAWRDAVRDVLGTLMANGARVTGFTAGWYIVDREVDQ